jgi:hypothetical protein
VDYSAALRVRAPITFQFAIHVIWLEQVYGQIKFLTTLGALVLIELGRFWLTLRCSVFRNVGEQFLKSLNSGLAPYEKLHTAGITVQVRLVPPRGSYVAKLATYGARAMPRFAACEYGFQLGSFRSP